MVVAPVTKTDATAALEDVPTLAPRPTFKNINAMEEAIIDAMEAIPSNQSEDWGYRGMVEDAARYALVCTTPWIWVADPGATRRGTASNPHPTLGTNLSSEEIASEKATWEAYKEAFNSQQAVKTAVIECLNRCVPKSYRRKTGANANNIGHRTYKPSEDPRAIIAELRRVYGTPTPQETRDNDTKFRAPWNVQTETIEDLFSRLEQCYIFSLNPGPAITTEQLIYQAKVCVMETNLYQLAVLEWNGFDPLNQTWAQFKLHFTEAYEILQQTTQTAGQMGYHSANNAMTDDDDSITTLQESMANMQTAANENTRVMNDNISQLTATTNQLRQQLATAQQQLAMMARQAPAQAPTQPTTQWAQPPAPAPYQANPYAPPPYVATQVATQLPQPPPPPQYQPHGGTYQGPNRRGRPWRRGGGRGRGRGRGYQQNHG